MGRPYVILNAAMTVDGKIVTKSGDSRISCSEDLNRLHQLRSRVDAVMVGAGTILADNPSLTVRRVRGKNPLRVVVDGEAKIPPSAEVLKGKPRTVIAVNSRGPPSKIKKLQRKAEIWIFPGKRISLQKLLKRLDERGIKKILLEGGSTLNWNMLREGLVDELGISISPCIVGGVSAKSLVGGEGFPTVSKGIKLKLIKIRRVGRDLLLVYKVIKRGAKKNH